MSNNEFNEFNGGAGAANGQVQPAAQEGENQQDSAHMSEQIQDDFVMLQAQPNAAGDAANNASGVEQDQ